MRVVIVGGGGREHALALSVRKSPLVSDLFVLPGNAGIAEIATCVSIGAKEIDRIVAFAVEQHIEFAIVAPDDPLVMGLVDELHAAGIPCFGPEKKAAVIEGSKAFAKELMRGANIPTAEYAVFTEEQEAVRYLFSCAYPIVVKADGLALGKGVVIAQDFEEAKAAVHEMMAEKRFGASGECVVIEEYLTGPEVSVLALTDGKAILPLPSSMDHKRVFDGDNGPNTGGMGAISPNPYYTEETAELCMERIFLPTIRALNSAGRTFKGCLYFGLMLTEVGPKVIEYNCRFGDPETQAVVPLIETGFFEAMLAVEEERLAEVELKIKGGACCCVALASAGYPGEYEAGKPISIRSGEIGEDVAVYHAGTKLQGEEVLTAGGRVLGVSAVGETLPAAVGRAYGAIRHIDFEGMHYRRDIGKTALRANRG